MVAVRRLQRVAHYRKRAARRMAESVSTFSRRARRNSAALGKSSCVRRAFSAEPCAECQHALSVHEGCADFRCILGGAGDSAKPRRVSFFTLPSRSDLLALLL